MIEISSDHINALLIQLLKCYTFLAIEVLDNHSIVKHAVDYIYHHRQISMSWISMWSTNQINFVWNPISNKWKFIHENLKKYIKMTSINQRWMLLSVFLLFLCENWFWVTGARLTRQTSSTKQNKGKENYMIWQYRDQSWEE